MDRQEHVRFSKKLAIRRQAAEPVQLHAAKTRPTSLTTILVWSHGHSTRSWRDLAFTVVLAFRHEVTRLSMLACVLADNIRAPVSVRYE
jgi:hypothetical protein